MVVFVEQGFVLQMLPAVKQGSYLLKDICKLAQNVLLQPVECGDAARKEKWLSDSNIDRFIHVKYITDELFLIKTDVDCIVSGSLVLTLNQLPRINADL